MMKTRFEPSVKWLEPFFDSAKDLIPAHKLQRVMGYRVPFSKDHKSEAMCTQYTENEIKIYYVISIALDVHLDIPLTKCFKCGRRAKKSARPLARNTLTNFAHELAHLKYIVHSHEHWDLEARISRRFTKVLKQMAIKDLAIRRPLKWKK